MLHPISALGATPKGNLPVELTDANLFLQYIGMSEAELKKVWFYRARMYHTFNISKVNGKKRVIRAPDKRLKMVQRKIVNLLEPLYRPRYPVHGFITDRSIKTNALSHLDGKHLLNLDLKDFFPSISENRVVGLFEALGINSDVALIMARLSCNHNQLPQGAPSSPIISNMICFRMDKELMQIAKEARCIYTRYADDLTFSSYQPLNGLFEISVPPAGEFLPELLSSKLKGAIQNNGFTINPAKVYYADSNSRQTVTGLRVNELLNVDRRYVRNIRAAIHVFETKGLKEAERKLREDYGRKSTISAHLHGKIAWLGHIKGKSDPVFRKFATSYNRLFAATPIKIDPTLDEIRDRAVWVIEHYDADPSQGSAFFLKGIGLVTAFHCVEGSSELEVYHPSKPANKFPVKVSKFCAARDLALLSHKILDTDFFELGLSSRQFKVGEVLTAAGYPGFGHGDKLNVRPGNITSIPVKNGVKMIEVTQSLASGMSGGPVLDSEFAVAGVIHKGGAEEDRDFAIHRDVLAAWLQEP